MTRNWKVLKSTVKSFSLAGSLKPKKRVFSKGNANNDDVDVQEAAPGLDDTNKSQKGDEHDEEEEAHPAHLSFGVDDSTKGRDESNRDASKSPRKKRKGKKMKETNKVASDEEGAEVTETTEEGEADAAPSYASFGIDNSSDHDKTSEDPLKIGHTDTTESAKAPAHQEFGVDDASAQVSENPSTAVPTEASRKSSKSRKKGKKLKSTKKPTEEHPRAKRKTGTATTEDDSQEEVSYICKALGMDAFKFFCLRHPDQVITRLQPCYEPVQKCSLCESEFQADPERMERLSKSMAIVTEKVQSRQEDTKNWKERTKVTNWPSSASSEALGSVSDDGKEKNVLEREWLDQVLERSLQVQAWKTLGKPPLRNDPDYARYFRLFRVGVPLIAVKFTVERDGFDPSVLDLSPDLPLETQRPVTSKDDNNTDRGDATHVEDASDPEGQFGGIPESIEKIQIAFNRLRAKDLRMKASVTGRNGGHSRRTRSRSRDAKKKRDTTRRSRSTSRDGKKKRNQVEGDKAGKRRMAKGKANEVDIDEKDRLISKLKDELAKKESEIESLHDKMHEMEQHMHNHSSSHHASFGSLSFNMSDPGAISPLGVDAKFLKPSDGGVADDEDTMKSDAAETQTNAVAPSDEPAKIQSDNPMDDASTIDDNERISERFENEYSSARDFGASSQRRSESAFDATGSVDEKDIMSDSYSDGYDSSGPAFVGDVLHDSINKAAVDSAVVTPQPEDDTASLGKDDDDEQQDTSDSFDDEYNTDPSDADVKGLESVKKAAMTNDGSSSSDEEADALHDASPDHEDDGNSSYSFEDEYPPTRSGADAEGLVDSAETLPALTAISSGEVENGPEASSDEDDDLAHAAALHAHDGSNLVASDDEIDDALALAASLHDNEDVVREQGSTSGSSDIESTSSSFDSDVGGPRGNDAAASRPQDSGDCDDDALELAASMHASDEKEDSFVNEFVPAASSSSDDDDDKEDSFVDEFNPEPFSDEDEGDFDSGGEDDTALELAASIHASEDKSNGTDEKEDSFVNEFAPEDSSDDEKEDSFVDEFNPEASSDAEAILDNPIVAATGSDDVNDDDDALNLAAALHAGQDTDGQDKDPSESSSSDDDDYTSGSSDTDDGCSSPEAVNLVDQEAPSVLPAMRSDDDDDDDALDLAEALHANEDNAGSFSVVEDSDNPGVFLDPTTPSPEEDLEPRHDTVTLLNGQHSDTEDDELMMAAALLAREDDDTSTSYERGDHLSGFDELMALQSAQQEAGLFYDGAMGPPAVESPNHDAASSDSSYEAVSSNGDGNDLDNALDDNDSSGSSYESYGDDEDSSVELF